MLDYVTISTQEAQAHFDEVADRASQGEHILITRDQKPWFVMVPVEDAGLEKIGRLEHRQKLIKDMISFGETYREQHGPTTVEEIKSWIDEGRRF